MHGDAEPALVAAGDARAWRALFEHYVFGDPAGGDRPHPASAARHPRAAVGGGRRAVRAQLAQRLRSRSEGRLQRAAPRRPGLRRAAGRRCRRAVRPPPRRRASTSSRARRSVSSGRGHFHARGARRRRRGRAGRRGRRIGALLRGAASRSSGGLGSARRDARRRCPAPARHRFRLDRGAGATPESYRPRDLPAGEYRHGARSARACSTGR